MEPVFDITVSDWTRKRFKLYVTVYTSARSVFSFNYNAFKEAEKWCQEKLVHCNYSTTISSCTGNRIDSMKVDHMECGKVFISSDSILYKLYV